MEEDLTELKESTFWSDFLKICVQISSCFYEQIKCRQVHDSQLYLEYEKDGFYQLAPSYKLFDKHFDVAQLTETVFARFVGLLASLTLYNFSKTSKRMFYNCLDLRGLEYKDVNLHHPQDSEPMWISGYEGMRVGSSKDDTWSPFQVCFGGACISMKTFVNEPSKMLFVKKYKNLWISFLDIYFDDYLAAFCDTFFHPGVEHVGAGIRYFHDDFEDISVEKAFMFLNYCTNVKHLEYYFSETFLKYPKFIGDPPFLPIKSRLEQWANTQTTGLEIFLFSYKNVAFQWHQRRLKRLVKYEDKWYWSDKCDIDNHRFKNYKHSDSDFYTNLPMCYTNFHKRHVLQTIKKLYFRINWRSPQDT